MSDVNNSYRSLSTEGCNLVRAMNSGNTDSVNIDDMKSSLDSYKTSVDELSGMKALRDEEVKEKYDTFAEQNEKFVGFMDGFVNSGDTVLQVGEECSASKVNGILRAGYDKVGDTYSEEIGPCLTALKTLSESDNESLAALGTEMGKAYEGLKDPMKQLQAAYIARDSSKIMSVARDVRDQASEATDSLKKTQDGLQDLEVNDQLNDLGRLVTDKANGKK